MLVGLFSLRLLIFQTRWFNPDEFEHLHAAWCTSKGSLAYRDFFEHHTPWFYYLLSPIVHGADKSEGTAITALFAARAVSLAITTCSVLVLISVGSISQRETDLLSGNFVGLSSALFIAGMPTFLDKTIEIRPDVPALLFWLCCLAVLSKALQKPRAFLFLISGFCLGAAIMFTQKLLFTLPGVAGTAIIWVLHSGRGEARRKRLTLVCVFATGLALPMLATWSFFELHSAGQDFFRNNFVLNARWKAAEPPQPFLRYILTDSWPIVLMALVGVGLLIRDCFATAPLDKSMPFEQKRPRNPDWAGILFLGTAISLLLGLEIIPVAMAQYYLPLLPLVCLFASRFMASMIVRLGPRFRLTYLLVLLSIMQISPVSHALKTRYWNNSRQLVQLSLVMSHSSCEDLILDGWKGLGVFRPHAWYYYFLHPEIRKMLPAKSLDAFLKDLESGRVVPKIITLDNNLRALSGRFLLFVQTHYENIGDDIWVRRSEQTHGPNIETSQRNSGV